MKEFSEKEILLLGYLEGDLTEAEKAKVEAMLAEDVALMNEYRLLSKTVLPVEEVSYSNKANLKKAVVAERISLSYIFWSGAVAAAIALLILWYSPTIKKNDSQVATIEETAKPVEEVKPNEAKEKSFDAPDLVIADATAATNKKTQVAKTTAKEKTAVVTKSSASDEEQPFEKQDLRVVTLSSKQATIPVVEIPTQEPVLANLELQPIEKPSYEEPKKWFARKTEKIGNTLTKWAGYLQKPKVEIDKKEPDSGRTYWAILVATDRYQWEGRLYTRR